MLHRFTGPAESLCGHRAFIVTRAACHAHALWKLEFDMSWFESRGLYSMITLGPETDRRSVESSSNLQLERALVREGRRVDSSRVYESGLGNAT